MGDVIVVTFNSLGYNGGTALTEYLSFNTLTSAQPLPNTTITLRDISFPFPVIVRYIVANMTNNTRTGAGNTTIGIASSSTLYNSVSIPNGSAAQIFTSSAGTTIIPANTRIAFRREFQGTGGVCDTIPCVAVFVAI